MDKLPTALENIAHTLQAQAKAIRATGKVTIEARAVTHLLRIASEAALQTACQVTQGGKPKGWTCLDTLSEASKMTSRYGAEFRAEIIAGKHLCDGCRLQAVLGE
jgi:hypothetical protein